MPFWGGAAASGHSGLVPLIRDRSTSQYVPITADQAGYMQMTDVGFKTAFGEKSTAQKVPERQYSFPMHLDVDQWDLTHTNTGTSYIEDSQLVVSSGTDTAGAATALSRDLMHYRSGQGLLLQCSAVYTTARASSTQMIGLGDADNGFFIGYSGDTFGIFHRNGNGSGATTTTHTPQAEWSEADKLNGLGDSGVTLDPTLPNVYMIQAQLHFMGKVNFYVVVNTCSFPKLVHTITWPNTDHSGQNTTVDYGNLPVHVSVTNSGNGTDMTVKTASVAAFIEGVLRNVGNEFSAYVEQVNISGSGVGPTKGEQAMLEIFNQNTVLGKTNHTDIIVNSISVASDNAGAPAVFRLHVDSTFAGVPGYNDVNSASSAAQVATTVRAVRPVITGTGKDSSTATTFVAGSLAGSDTNADAGDYVNDRIIVITAGLGIGQSRRILDHAWNSGDAENTLTVARWQTIPDDTSNFTIVNGQMRRAITCGQNSSEVVNFEAEHSIHLPPGSKLTVTVQCNDSSNRMMCALGWDEIQ